MVRRTQRTVATRPSMLTRMKARAAGRKAGANRTTVTTTTTTTPTYHHTTHAGHHTTHTGHHNATVAPVHHQRRPSVGDKVSGALMKLRGSLTRRPGLKAAGTRRMRGTDGRGSVRAY